MLFCILLIIIEVLLQLTPMNYDCVFLSYTTYEKLSELEKEQMCNEYSTIKFYSQNPILLLEPKIGKFVNINSDGFRGKEIDFQNIPYKIFFLGGSTAFGEVSSSDNTTITSFLEKKFQNTGIDIKIINAGIPSATSVDEVYYIENYILDFKPDLIITYDGWNDIHWIDRIKLNISYEEFSSKNAYKNMETISSKNFYSISKPIFYFFEEMNYKTGLVVGLSLFKFVDNLNNLQETDLKISAEQLSKIENNIITNWSKICKLGESNEFKVINILQPMLGTSDRIFHYKENQIIDSDLGLDSDYLKNINIESISSKSTCVNVYDLRNALDGFDNIEIYFDNGHMADSGNEIIAENIFEKIFSIVKEDIKNKNYLELKSLN